MALLLKALCIFGVLLAISLQTSSAFPFPRLCKCMDENSIERFPYLKKITDFSIKERGDGCDTEILLTTSRKDALEICLKPGKNQGQRLQHCWEKTIQRDENRKQECLRKLFRP